MSALPSITRVAAYGLIVEGGKILLCRISERVPPDVGLWTLPGGGLDFGEDPADAVVREVYEETGLTVRPRSVAGIDSVHLALDDRHLHGVRILYRVALLGGTLRPETDGTTDLAAWWTLDEARTLPLVDLVEAALPLAFAEG